MESEYETGEYPPRGEKGGGGGVGGGLGLWCFAHPKYLSLFSVVLPINFISQSECLSHIQRKYNRTTEKWY